MSLARAMTKRIKRSDAQDSSVPPVPARGKPVKPIKMPTAQIDRSKISGPLALVSTTNMLSYNAPDVASFRKGSLSAGSSTDPDDSDNSVLSRSRASSHASRETLTDASSVNSSPTSPAPNHLSGYFAAANKNVRKSISSGNLQQLREADEEQEPVPAIPERALSHSKRAHERMAQKRSTQSISRHSSTRSLREQRSSLDMFSNTIHEESHPFGKELEQLSEVAEEFGGAVRDATHEADYQIMRERNLASFCAADYLALIEPLYSIRFESHVPVPMAWI